MSRLISIVFAMSLAIGCSALPETNRSRMAINSHPIPVEKVIDSVAEITRDARISQPIATKWLPEEIMVGSGFDADLDRQQQALAQHWEPAFLTNQAIATLEEMDPTEFVRPSVANQTIAMLSPLPESACGPPHLGIPENSSMSHSTYVSTPSAETLPAPTNSKQPESVDFRLDQMLTQLQSASRLRLERVCLCQEVTGFGQVAEFADAKFAIGDEVLIYCEIGNFKSVAEADQQSTTHRTSLSGSFVIMNLDGDIVAEQEYAAVDDISQTQRDDFFLVFPAQIPELEPGKYRLYVVVNDELAQELAAHGEPIQFQIVSNQQGLR